MSENSLKIRGKFINNLSNDIANLNEKISLLQRVDRKILRTSQTGGAEGIEVKELQKKALLKRIQVEMQNLKLDKAIKDAQALTTKVGELNNALKGIQANIDAINVSDIKLDIAVPDVNSYKEAVMNNLNEKKLWDNIADKDALGINKDEYNGLLKDVYEIADVDSLEGNLKGNKNWNDADKKMGVSEELYNSFLAANQSAPSSGPAPTSNKYFNW